MQKREVIHGEYPQSGDMPKTNLKDLTLHLQGGQQIRIRHITNFPIQQKYKPEYIRVLLFRVLRQSNGEPRNVYSKLYLKNKTKGIHKQKISKSYKQFIHKNNFYWIYA